MTTTTPDMLVLSDEPTDVDSFGLGEFRDILRDTLLYGPTPITVGVFGDWGSGKTSLMRILKKEVEDEGHHTLWFDAWKFLPIRNR